MIDSQLKLEVENEHKMVEIYLERKFSSGSITGKETTTGHIQSRVKSGLTELTDLPTDLPLRGASYQIRYNATKAPRSTTTTTTTTTRPL